MKLPGELRNRIYELVFPSGEGIKIRERRRERRRSSPGERAKRLRWREPGLLSASRQIRAECFALYYGRNHFTILAKANELDKALNFLLQKSIADDEDDREINVSYVLRLVNASWWDMPQWLKLATIAWHTGGDFDCEGWNSAVAVYSEAGDHVDLALQDVMRLGYRARLRGQEWEELREDFVNWAATVCTIFRKVHRSRSDGIAQSIREAIPQVAFPSYLT